jgi:hypothetical protein
MEVMLWVALGGVILYGFIKVALFIFRPFYIRKYLRALDALYGKVHNECVKDFESAVSMLDEWKKADDNSSIRRIKTEESLNDTIESARTALEHEEQLNDKFTRLQVRFQLKPEKLGEGISHYKSYLDVKVKHNQETSIYTSALTTGVTTLEEFAEHAKKTRIVLEELERKIDVLLNEQSQ